MAPNPYPGLRPFEAADTAFFFGRDGSIHDILEKLQSRRFVAVVGPSGCGKSSLIRAGVVPAFINMPGLNGPARPAQVLMRPGAAPLRNLHRALNAATGADIEDVPQDAEFDIADAIWNNVQSMTSACLIVFDQFEEVFRYGVHSGEGEADRFVRLLLRLTGLHHISVVMTMRADFLGECVRFSDLPEALNSGQYLLPRLTRRAIQEVIESPATCSQLAVEPALVERIMNDMGSEPDQLALMQHALRRTCDQALRRTESGSNGAVLSLQDYYEVGGIAGSLSLQAEEIFGELASDDARGLCRSMFRQLAEKQSGGYAVRRPTPVSIVAAAGGTTIATVLEIAASFSRQGRNLLMPDVTAGYAGPDTILDISHEALFRNWPRLQEWIEEEDQSARMYQRLAREASEWEAGRASLSAGPTLEIALDWHSRERPTPAWASRYITSEQFESVVRFLELSGKAAEGRAGARHQPPRPKQATVRKGIFLSYRREDSSHAADRIYEGLVRRFGKKGVFYDVETIPSGIDYSQFISERIDTCAVLLAVIGDLWTDIRFREGPQKGQRRLDDPTDLVRLEIETAWRLKVPVIPVFVGREPLPTGEDLPAGLKPLANLSFATLGSGPDFRNHFDRLLETVDRMTGRSHIGLRLLASLASRIS